MQKFMVIFFGVSFLTITACLDPKIKYSGSYAQYRNPNIVLTYDYPTRVSFIQSFEGHLKTNYCERMFNKSEAAECRADMEAGLKAIKEAPPYDPKVAARVRATGQAQPTARESAQTARPARGSRPGAAPSTAPAGNDADEVIRVLQNK